MKDALILGIAMLAVGGAWTFRPGASLASPGQETRTEKSLPAEGVRAVKAAVEVGAVTVRSDSREVRVIAVRTVKGEDAEFVRRWREETRLLIERQGDSIVIKDVIPAALKEERRNRRRFTAKLDLEIHIPRGLSLQVDTGVGAVDAGGQFASLNLTSGVGDVAVEGSAGDVRVKSGVGKLNLRGLSVSGAALDANTGVGEVEMGLRSLPSRELNLTVGVGNVRVAVPGSVKASVEMKTGIGKLTSDFPLPSTERRPFQPGEALKGDINGGGPSLKVSVGTGDARLMRN